MNRLSCSLSAALAPLLTCALLTGSAHAGDELFVADGNMQIYKGDPSGEPLWWTTTSAVPQALLFHGGDLIVGTAAGSILRLDTETGEVLQTHDTGHVLLDMAIHDGRLLVGAGDNLIHLVNPVNGSSMGTLHPTTTIASIEIHGDRVYVGSTDGLIKWAPIHTDVWTTLLDSAPGAVTDMTFGGDVLYFTSTNSSSVFIVSDENAQNVREYVVQSSPPTSLAVTGNSIIVGTSWGGIYDYDVPTFATNGLAWVYTHITSLVVSRSQSTGTGYCEGDLCPCGNTSLSGGCTNSTGAGAALEATGNSNTSLGDVDVHVQGLPTNSFAVIYMSQGAAQAPFGDGRLCVGGSAVCRYPVQSTGPQGWVEELGVAHHSVDHFDPAGHIDAGQSWNFQAWYRDLQGSCGSGFNTSNAWSVSFTE